MFNLQSPIEENIFTQLDARVKLLFGLELVILLTLISDIVLLSIIIIFPVMIYVYLNSIKSLVSLIWSFKWYFLVFILFGTLLTDALSLYELGLVMFKFMGLFLAFASISRTTSPDEVTEVLLKLKVPSSLAWAVGTTLRQVYFIYSEIFVVRSIQKANDDNETSTLENISNLITSVYANAIIRSEQFTRTLRARGFVKAHSEIITFDNSLKMVDFVALLLCLLPSGIYLIYSSQVFI